MGTRRLSVFVLAGLLVLFAAPVAAQERPLISTPFPGVAVEPGQSATFDVDVTPPTPQIVTVALTEVPEGWDTTLRGGGFVIDSVFADPEEPPRLRLEVDVPPDAAQGEHQIVLTATAPAGTEQLVLTLRVEEAVAGGVTLEAEFPTLRGSADATFTFNLDLINDTPEEITFSLQGEGREGWQVEVRPSGERRAATTTVAGGDDARIVADVTPPPLVAAGTYPVLVRAVGSGQTVEAELGVEITGSFALRLRTPEERLNAQVRVGSTSDVPLLVINDGSAPLRGVELSATPPTGWEVTFDPEVVEEVPPGEAADVTATIRPSGQAVAGDYLVTLRAEVPEASDQIDVRTTVEASPLLGFVGLALIAVVLFGLAWVFRRYGRR